MEKALSIMGHDVPIPVMAAGELTAMPQLSQLARWTAHTHQHLLCQARKKEDQEKKPHSFSGKLTSWLILQHLPIIWEGDERRTGKRKKYGQVWERKALSRTPVFAACDGLAHK